MKKTTIIGLIMTLVFVTAVLGAYTVKDVIVSDETGAKIAGAALKTKTSESEITANIIESHFMAIDKAETMKQCRKLEIRLNEKVDMLVSIQDPTLMQEVLNDIDVRLDAKFDQAKS